MKFMLFAMLALIVIPLRAQEIPPIMNTLKPQRGIYRNFQEFLNDAPSIHSPFQIVTKSGDARIEKDMGDYKLLLLDSVTRRRDLKKIWGVSDGEKIYVNEVQYGGSFKFKKILGVGRYCYFNGTKPPNYAPIAGVAGGLVGAGMAIAASEMSNDIPYILNINTGKFYVLDKTILRTILKKDQELYDQYEDGEKKSKPATLVSYIVKYNERNMGDIKYNKPEAIDVCFYRRENREKDALLNLNVGDSIQLSLTPRSIQEMTWKNDSIDVCIGQMCKTIALEKKKINYVECSWKPGGYEFKKVEVKVGEFYTREIRTVNERMK